MRGCRRPRQLLDRAGEPHPSAGEHHHAIADRLHVGEHVRRDKHRLAVITGKRDQPTEHRPTLEWIEAVGRLVENHHPRIMDNRRGEGHLLSRADREGFHRAIPLLSGVAPIEHLMGPPQALGAGQPAQPGRIPHHLDAGEPRHGTLVFGHDPEERPHPPRLAGRIEAIDTHASLRQPHKPEDRPHQRALAGAVGAHQTSDAGRHLERHAIEHSTAAVAFHDTVEPDREIIPQGGTPRRISPDWVAHAVSSFNTGP